MHLSCAAGGQPACSVLPQDEVWAPCGCNHNGWCSTAVQGAGSPLPALQHGLSIKKGWSSKLLESEWIWVRPPQWPYSMGNAVSPRQCSKR